MFRAYGSFPNSGNETSSIQNSLRSPLENIQTWSSSPIAPSSSPDFHCAQTQPNINNQRQNNIQHLQQSQFQNNLHAHQQQHPKSQPFYIEALNNNNSINNGLKNNEIKGIKIKFYFPSYYGNV